MKTLTSIVLPSAASRLADARARLVAIEPPLVIVAATRAAADEFAFSIAEAKGATFGITRSSVAELVAKTRRARARPQRTDAERSAQ